VILLCEALAYTDLDIDGNISRATLVNPGAAEKAATTASRIANLNIDSLRTSPFVPMCLFVALRYFTLTNLLGKNLTVSLNDISSLKQSLKQLAKSSLAAGTSSFQPN
jgi:hypothetical protein